MHRPDLPLTHFFYNGRKRLFLWIKKHIKFSVQTKIPLNPEWAAIISYCRAGTMGDYSLYSS